MKVLHQSDNTLLQARGARKIDIDITVIMEGQKQMVKALPQEYIAKYKYQWLLLALSIEP
jgi:hypothetical protein